MTSGHQGDTATSEAIASPPPMTDGERRALFYARVADRLPPFLRSPANRYLLAAFQGTFAPDPEAFRGRKILIVGPARTVEKELSEIAPADYDVIVKMNNGLDTPIRAEGLAPYRCDILFHSLTGDARPVTPETLRRAGVQMLVHRTVRRRAFLDTLRAADRFRGICSVRNIPFPDYAELGRRLSGASPTTGLVCSRFFLNAPVQSVAITGFTFFSTAYTKGYDDRVASDEEAASRVASEAHHAPRMEATLLADLVNNAREKGKTVVLGSELSAAAARLGVTGL